MCRQFTYLLFIRNFGAKINQTDRGSAGYTLRLRCRSIVQAQSLAVGAKGNSTRRREMERPKAWERGREGNGREHTRTVWKYATAANFITFCGIHCIRKLTPSSHRAFNVFVLCRWCCCFFGRRMWADERICWIHFVRLAAGAARLDVLFTLESIAVWVNVCLHFVSLSAPPPHSLTHGWRCCCEL